MPLRLVLSGIGAAVLLAATVLAGLYLGIETRDRFRSIDESWRQYAMEADRRGELLSRIRGLLGYGGIIHNFKNYVLRQDESYLIRVRYQFADFKATVHDYRQSHASAEELSALKVIEETMATYESKVPIAITAAAEKWSTIRTDRLVKVDDTEAIKALAALDAYWRDKRHSNTEAIAGSVVEGQELVATGFRFLAGLALVALIIYGLFYVLQAELRKTVRLLSSELTERKAAEHVAKKFSQAVEQSPATIVITGTDGLIEYVNRKFCQVSGYLPKEVLGHTPRLLQSGETPPEVYFELKQRIANGQEWRGVFRNRKKNGDSYWAQTTILPLRDEGGDITHFIGLGEDITERRKAREQIQQAQKMEAVGLLASGLAHDFNNVLTTILGNVHLALSDTPKDGELREELEQIEVAAKRAGSLVSEILAFARRRPAAPVPIRLADAVDEVCRLMRASIPSNIAIDCCAGERSELSVFADPTRLHQVIMNLCSNAAEAIGADNGSITLRIERVTPNGKKDSLVRLTVADTGPGIPAEQRSKVFEPFFTTKPLGRGTGLGLSVVSNLVGEMGGSITIQDGPGPGACFEMLLPESNVVPEPVRHEERAVGGSDRILLVDDETEVVATCRKLLERLGYKVDAYTDPIAAVQAYETNPERYDLVMTDFVMPEMNGEEVCRAVRAQGSDCPIVVCTAYQPGTLDQNALKPLRVLDKPVDPVQLSRVVRGMLDARHEAETAG
jgi:PAS domain S-box-containing protein